MNIKIEQNISDCKNIIEHIRTSINSGKCDTASDGLESAITNYNHSEQSRCISATFLF